MLNLGGEFTSGYGGSETGLLTSWVAIEAGK